MSEIFDVDERTLAEFRELMQTPEARAAFIDLKSEHLSSGTGRTYTHVLKLVGSTAWAIRPEMLAIIVDVLAFRARGGRFSAEEIAERIGSVRRAPTPAGPKGIAVLALEGVMIPKADAFGEMSGGTSVQSFRQNFRSAVDSPDVSGIVLNVDSPGGMVDQVPEMAAEIRAARGAKPIVAVANTEAASAAYWLASQADQIIASPSARLGSIGVVSAHEDESAKQAQQGIQTTLVSAGKYKTESNPFAPLSEEGRAHLQSMVDAFYTMFVNDVAAGRGVSADAVRNGYGEGRVLNAADAVKAGLADGVGTLEQVVGNMLAEQRTAQVALVSSQIVTTDLAERFLASSEYSEYEQLREQHNQEALARLQEEHMADPGFSAAVDNTAWDGNRAMTECSSASDYASICAATHTTGMPGERQHYALPHHYLSKVPSPNADGVRNALSRLPQTQNITDAERARAQRHLDAHMREINPQAHSVTDDIQAQIDLMRD